MRKKIGYATYKRGALYFDEVGWAMVKGAAKRKHQSPKRIVIDALLRYTKIWKKVSL